MLADLERGLAIVRDGREIIPAWRILTPDGDFLVLTRFDPDHPDQRERMLALVPRFMAWKLATAFVLTAETWLGPQRTRSGEEAVLTIGVSRHECLGVIRRIRRTPAIAFAPAEWLGADAIDEHYFRLLPVGQTAVTAEEAAMLADVFGEDGELPAQRLN
jgi:plasmid maintenance system antidote protein VapI